MFILLYIFLLLYVFIFWPTFGGSLFLVYVYIYIYIIIIIIIGLSFAHITCFRTREL